jgi:hypothetical protein
MANFDKSPRFSSHGGWSRRQVLQGGVLAGLSTAGLSVSGRTGFAQTAMKEAGAELVAAAKAEGTLTYYHTTAIDPTAVWTKAFTDKYGITTQNVRGPSYPLFERWLTEERVGQHVADLVQITDTVLIESAHAEGLIADYVPASAVGVRPEMKKDGVWYTIFVNAMGIAWNSTKVSPEEDKLIREGGWAVPLGGAYRDGHSRIRGQQLLLCLYVPGWEARPIRSGIPCEDGGLETAGLRQQVTDVRPPGGG